MTKRTLFLIAVALQVALLGWMVASSERTLGRGALFVLKVRPVDPVDFMTGRYVAVHPEIGTLDATRVRVVGQEDEETTTPTATQDLSALMTRTVFVELRTEGDFAVAQRVVVAAGAIEPRVPFLRGRVVRAIGSELQVDYGLDRFDVPYDAEDPSSLAWSRDHVLALVVRVAADGRAVTEDLRIDGQPFAAWNAAEKAKRK